MSAEEVEKVEVDGEEEEELDCSTPEF